MSEQLLLDTARKTERLFPQAGRKSHSNMEANVVAGAETEDAGPCPCTAHCCPCTCSSATREFKCREFCHHYLMTGKPLFHFTAESQLSYKLFFKCLFKCRRVGGKMEFSSAILKVELAQPPP